MMGRKGEREKGRKGEREIGGWGDCKKIVGR